jgi:hypothetical protein
MRVSLLASLLILTGATAAARAQAPAIGNELSGELGYRSREEFGRTLGGFSAGLSYIPRAGTAAGWELGLSYVQVTAYSNANAPTVLGGTASDDKQRENSLDVAARLRFSLARGPVWSFEGAVGPVLSFALGCTTGGGAGSGSNGYGTVPCVNSFAQSGTRVGADVQARSLWRAGQLVRFYLGASGAAGTVGAGRSIALGVNAGLRLALLH